MIGITNLHFTYHVKTLTTLYINTETRKILRMAFWRGQYSLCQILTSKKGVSSIFNFLEYIHIITHMLIRSPLEIVHVLNLQTIYTWCFFNWSLRENIVKLVSNKLIFNNVPWWCNLFVFALYDLQPRWMKGELRVNYLYLSQLKHITDLIQFKYDTINQMLYFSCHHSFKQFQDLT